MNKKIKLLLVNVESPKISRRHPPLSLLMLANYLIKKKVLPKKNIKIINTIDDDPVRFTSVFKPDLIGFSAMTPVYPHALKLAKAIRQESRAFLIIGGYHFSGLPYLLDRVFDLGVIGEGEGALSDIVKILNQGKKLNEKNLSPIKNIVFHNQKREVIVNPMRPLLQPKEIPDIPWSMLPREKIFKYMTIVKNGKPILAKSGNTFTARGCPYKCRFCAAQIMWPDKYGFRMFPIKKVGQEISNLYYKYKINSIHIWDDTFAVSKKRLKELIKELKKRNLLGKITFDNLYVRPNLIDEEFAQLLSQFGVTSVYIGFESGSKLILDYLKNKSLTVKETKKAVNLLQKEDINIAGSLMLFSPREKISDLKKSYQLAKWLSEKNNVYFLRIVVTCPFPGTDLWSEAIKQGIFNKTKMNWRDFIVVDLNSTKMTKVFFENNFSLNIHQKYWDKFQSLSKKVDKRTKSIKGWHEVELEAKKMNNQNEARIKRFKSLKEMQIRIIRFFNNPVKTIKKLDWQTVKHVLRDLSQIFLKKDKILKIVKN